MNTIKLIDLVPPNEKIQELNAKQREIDAVAKILTDNPELVQLTLRALGKEESADRLNEAELKNSRLVQKLAWILLAAGLSVSDLTGKPEDVTNKLLAHFKPKETQAAIAPVARELTPNDAHAYSKAAGQNVGKAYEPKVAMKKATDLSKLTQKAVPPPPTPPKKQSSEPTPPKKSKSDSYIINIAADEISRYENDKYNRQGGYNFDEKKWFPHASVERGSDTIAYGHKIQRGEDFSGGLTDDEARDLLRADVASKLNIAKRQIKGFNEFDEQLKKAILNALFRGDMGAKTMALLSKKQFRAAAEEYLNHKEFKTTKRQQIKDRMLQNYHIIKRGGQ